MEKTVIDDESQKGEEPLLAYIKAGKIFLKHSSEVKNLRERGYGQLKRNRIYLNPYEAFYLVEKGKIAVRDPTSQSYLMLQDLIKMIDSGEVETWIKYLVYRDFRERGYIVRKSKIVDFEIYGKSVVRRLVYIIHEGTEASLERLNRLLIFSKKERKELVLAVIDRRTDIVYYILDYLEFEKRSAPWIK